MKSKTKEEYLKFVPQAIEYYNTLSKDIFEAIWRYKTQSYEVINGILSRNLITQIPLFYSFKLVSENKINTENFETLAKSADQQYEFSKQINNAFTDIPLLDQAIDHAPKIPKSIKVFRGLKSDDFFKKLFFCNGSKIYIKFPTYLSTSFEGEISDSFSQTYIDGYGVMCTLLLPKHTHGLFLPSLNNPKQIPFNERIIDSEFEFLLPRDCVFEVVSLKLEPSIPITSLKNKDTTCGIQNLPVRRHYTLRLVQQSKFDSFNYQEFKKEVCEKDSIKVKIENYFDINLFQTNSETEKPDSLPQPPLDSSTKSPKRNRSPKKSLKKIRSPRKSPKKNRSSKKSPKKIKSSKKSPKKNRSPKNNLKR